MRTRPTAAKIPATVITGFLGAGKTSLIRALLQGASGTRLALIINEFGELGVDGEVLAGCEALNCTEDDIIELANVIAAGRDAEAETSALTRALGVLAGPAVLVSNEVGLGIVPDNALARHFRDLAGGLHQAVGELAQSVVFVVAGLPLHLKAPADRGATP